MRLLRDPKELQDSFGRIKRCGPDWSTSFFATPITASEWVSESRLWCVEGSGALLILRDRRGFFQLYHVAEDLGSLGILLLQLPTKFTYVADIIALVDAPSSARYAYEDAGFVPYKRLDRMLAPHPLAGTLQAHEVRVALESDAGEIHAFFSKLLDRYAEQVPDMPELVRLIGNGVVLIAIDKLAVTGVLVYDFKGITAHLRYWHVDPRAQCQGVGRALFAAFVDRCSSAKRFLLWVLSDNRHATEIYKRYGFSPDGMVDQVMLRKGVG